MFWKFMSAHLGAVPCNSLEVRFKIQLRYYEGDKYQIAVEVISGLLYLYDTKYMMHGSITT